VGKVTSPWDPTGEKAEREENDSFRRDYEDASRRAAEAGAYNRPLFSST